MRAREDAARTSEKLRALGFEPVLSPVLEIVATEATIPSGEYDAVLASSAKGVECAGNISALLGMPLHAVGAKTAKAAETRGWRPDIVAGNAEAILPLLLARYAQPAHFLYLAGRDRQAALEAGLRAAGHRVTAIDVYEARAATALGEDARRALAAGDIDIALHYSRRSVEIFLALAEAVGLTPRLGGVTHLALSDDVATPLRAIALEPRVAQKPNEERLLALLRQV
nr:uroporphyrinogen-III synthase [Methylocystis sp. WRRC1]